MVGSCLNCIYITTKSTLRFGSGTLINRNVNGSLALGDFVVNRRTYMSSFYQNITIINRSSRWNLVQPQLSRPPSSLNDNICKDYSTIPVPATKTSYVNGNVIDGKAIAADIKSEIKSAINLFLETHPKRRRPHLSVMLIGNDPASLVYVQNKRKAATETGITCDILRLPQTVSEHEIKKEIKILNRDSSVDGIIVQLPLPGFLNERSICDSVLPEKDVDGFNVLNVGRFCVDQKAFIPATPLGVLELLKRLNIDTHGKNAVVCGRSKNVGLPIALHLLSSKNGNLDAGNATTTICHRHTPLAELKMHTQRADILVTATGTPNLITADMVKEGVVVIDIGITRVKEAGRYKLVGDVDFSGVKEKAGLITPVPGGVGPITVAMVLKNTLKAYKKVIKFDSSNLQHVSR